jgi:hypothetical protein
MTYDKVRVYKNLHKNCYSVKSVKTGLVVAHVDEIVLQNVKYLVYESGRKRVLESKQKNVHAFVEGYIIKSVIDLNKPSKVCYNPYKKGFFFYCSNGRKITSSKYAKINRNGVFSFKSY